MSHLVFVYGTLQRGQPYHDEFVVKRQKGHISFVGEVKTVDKWPLVVATEFNIPFVLDRPGIGHHLLGELYKVGDDMLQVLDEAESCPEFYQRKSIAVTMVTGPDASNTDGKTAAVTTNIQECHIYVLQNYKDELLDLTFWEKYDAVGNPAHKNTPASTRNMDLDEFKVYLKSAVKKS